MAARRFLSASRTQLMPGTANLAPRCHLANLMEHRSSAVAERPRDASCLSVVSSQWLSSGYLVKEFWKSVYICQSYYQASSGFTFLEHGVVASASDSLCVLCSVVFGVTLRFSVINNIRWRVAWRRLLIAETDDAKCSTKCWRHTTVQQWLVPKPVIGRKSRFFAPGGSLCRNIVITFGMENCVTSRWWKNLEAIFIHFDRIYEHDRQTDRWTPHDGIGLGIAKQYLAGYRGNNVTSWVSTLAVITIHIAGLISCLFSGWLGIMSVFY